MAIQMYLIGFSYHERRNKQRVGLWKSCSLQGFGLWNLWSLLGLFGVLTLQSVRGAHSCSQGVILSEVIQIALCPLNA
ncbi:hypothetical protein JHK85_013004 [Glycine max]|nr:hypothetical protein JHK85_013004 [Glycine max]